MGQAASAEDYGKVAGALAEKRVPANEQAYWNLLWQLPTRSEDVWQVFTLEFMERIKTQAPANMGVLIGQLVLRLRKAVFHRELGLPRFDPLVVLNCVRILSRCLAVMLEDEHDQYATEFLWSSVKPPPPPGPPPPLPPSPPSSQPPAVQEAAAAAPSSHDGGPPIIEMKEPQFVATPVHRHSDSLVAELSSVQQRADEAKDDPTKNGDAEQGSKQHVLPSTAQGQAGAGREVNGGAVDQSADPSSLSSASMSQLPLAEQIVYLLTQLLFMPGLTIVADHPAPVQHGVYFGKLWTGDGLYSPAEIDSNRTEILRCLLVCFSEGVFKSPHNYQHAANRWLACMVSPHHKLAPTLFYSLLNTVCTYDPVGILPYSYAIFSDTREPLVDASLQLLLVLLDFRDATGLGIDYPLLSNASALGAPQVSGKARDSESTSRGPERRLSLEHAGPGGAAAASIDVPIAAPLSEQEALQSPRNVFLDCFLSITSEEDLRVAYNGLSRLLSNVHEARSTRLPGSMKQVECYQEALVLLWKFLDENENFFKYALQRSDITQLVKSILFLMYESRQDPSKVGLIYTAVFILLRLSGERDFSVALNERYDQSLPWDVPRFSGSYADLLIIVCHKLIVTSPEYLDALLNVVLTIIANISPYITRLELLASVKLVTLFELFSSPKFLYANETNHQYIFLLLDVFNNIIQYQYQGNSKLVYAIARRAKLFYRIGRLPPPPQASASDEAASPAQEQQQQQPSVLPAESTENQHDEQKALAEPHEVPPPPPAKNQEGAFVPTEEWVLSWKQALPLEVIFRLLEFLLPKVEALCKKEGHISEERFLELIQSTTLVGVLPLPHNIVVRRYVSNAFTNLWFTTCTWGLVFLRNPGLLPANRVRMFVVSSPEGSSAGREEEEAAAAAQ